MSVEVKAADQSQAAHVTSRARKSVTALMFISANPVLVAGAVATIALLLMGLLAPIIAPYPPETVDFNAISLAPSPTHIFGTDSYGMDVFSRIIYAARIDMVVALSVVAISIIIGTPLGAIAGFFGGTIIDSVMMRFVDAVQAFPAFILAVMTVAILGQRVLDVVIVIAFLHFPSYLRLVRAKVLSARKSQYADAARCIGNGNLRLIFRHLLPNCIDPIFPQSSLNAGYAILLTAGLSFIGVGVRPPTPEWGAMINLGSQHMLTGEWWTSFFPGLAMIIAVLGFNLVSDGLQDLHDPTRRRR